MTEKKSYIDPNTFLPALCIDPATLPKNFYQSYRKAFEEKKVFAPDSINFKPLFDYYHQQCDELGIKSDKRPRLLLGSSNEFGTPPQPYERHSIAKSYTILFQIFSPTPTSVRISIRDLIENGDLAQDASGQWRMQPELSPEMKFIVAHEAFHAKQGKLGMLHPLLAAMGVTLATIFGIKPLFRSQEEREGKAPPPRGKNLLFWTVAAVGSFGAMFGTRRLHEVFADKHARKDPLTSEGGRRWLQGFANKQQAEHQETLNLLRKDGKSEAEIQSAAKKSQQSNSRHRLLSGHPSAQHRANLCAVAAGEEGRLAYEAFQQRREEALNSPLIQAQTSEKVRPVAEVVK